MRRKLNLPSIVITCLFILVIWNTCKKSSIFRPARVTTCLSFQDRILKTAALDDRKPGVNANYNANGSSNHLKPRPLSFDIYSKIQITNVSECQNRKLLVLKCGQKKCGGFGDRIKGIVSVFLMALLSNRSLVIDMTIPCDLSYVLSPNIYNWDICVPYVRSLPQKKSLDLDFGIVDLGHWKFLRRDFDFDASWRKRVMFVFFDAFILGDIRRHRDFMSQLGWMQYETNAEVTHRVIHTLLKPDSQIRQELENLREVLNGRNLFCSHIRTDKDPRFHLRNMEGVNVSMVFSYLDQIDPNQYMIYVATDLDTVRTDALKRFRAIITSRCESIHIDFSKQINERSKCDALYSTVLEWYVLSSCDSILISKSGFGCTSLYARGASDNIHVYFRNENKIVQNRLEDLDGYCRMMTWS